MMSEFLSQSCVQYLLIYCTMLFGVACSVSLIVCALYLSVRLSAFILREYELYRYRRASVGLRRAEAARAEARLQSLTSK